MEIEVTKTFRTQTAMQFPVVTVAEMEQQESNVI